MSDKEIVERLALIKYLLPGDLVIADRGFTGDSMNIAVMKTPPFTKGRKQLEKMVVDWGRELSSIQIHVERLIGLLKQKYKILRGFLPITFISHTRNEQASIDKLVRVPFNCSCTIVFHTCLVTVLFFLFLNSSLVHKMDRTTFLWVWSLFVDT